MVWGSSSTTTNTTTIPGMGERENVAGGILSELGTRGLGQLGNLSDLASGKLQISPHDEALIRRIQELTGESARNQVGANYDFMSGQLEDDLLGSGIGKSSMEAVKKAMLGQQLQRSLDESSLQGQISSAQQLRDSQYQTAGIKLNANQLLLNQILGGAGSVAEMALKERLSQSTTTTTTESNDGLLGGLTDLASLSGLGLGAIIPKVGGMLVGSKSPAAVSSQPASSGGSSSVNIPNQSRQMH